MAYHGARVPTDGLGIVRRQNVLGVVSPPLSLLGGLGQVQEPPLVTSAPAEETLVVEPAPPAPWRTAMGWLSVAGIVAGAYHGYKRNESAAWAFGWAVFGSAIPIFALPLAFAQGFAQPKRG